MVTIGGERVSFSYLIWLIQRRSAWLRLLRPVQHHLRHRQLVTCGKCNLLRWTLCGGILWSVLFWRVLFRNAIGIWSATIWSAIFCRENPWNEICWSATLRRIIFWSAMLWNVNLRSAVFSSAILWRAILRSPIPWSAIRFFWSAIR